MMFNTLQQVTIDNHSVKLNEVEIFKKDDRDTDFLASLYASLSIAYPKFHKMDAISQLCFLATEILLSKVDLSLYDAYEKSIYIETNAGCLLSDLSFSESQKSTPSPSTFVYTLPNVMIGEISIRHHFKGESFCIVSDTFEPKKQIEDVASLLQKRSKICIHGWVNVDKNNEFAQLNLSVL